MSTGLSPDLFGSTGVGPPNQAQVDAVKTILGLGGGALALGAGLRGLSGLGNFVGRSTGAPARTPMRQSFVRIPVPVKVHSRAERDAMLAAAEAEEKEARFVKLADGALDWAAKHIANAGGLLRQPGEQAGWLRDQLGGWGNASGWQMPWAYPATAAAVGGGLYGGWKLTDYLLGKTRTAEQESELEEARKEYESALAGRRDLPGAKVASAGSPLDALADLYEKRALWDEAKGLALLGALGLMGGAGYGGYQWARSTAADKAVEEAVKRRQAQIAEQAPSPVMAIPTPVPIMPPGKPWHHRLTGAGGAGDEEDEKVAHVGRAADEFLNRIRSNQMAVWNRLMTPADAKPAKPAKPEEPPPPQLPTLAGQMGRVTGGRTMPHQQRT